MKKNIKSLVYLLLVFMMISLVFVGCTGEEKPNPPNENMENEDMDNDNVDEYNDDTTDDMNEDMDTDMTQRADMISEELVNMDNIEDASVLITGNTALIAVDMGEDNADMLTEDMRNEISTKVMEMDEEITNVNVTAEPDMFDRLDEIGESIRQGDPIDDFVDEIEDLTDRFTNNNDNSY